MTVSQINCTNLGAKNSFFRGYIPTFLSAVVKYIENGISLVENCLLCRQSRQPRAPPRQPSRHNMTMLSRYSGATGTKQRPAGPLKLVTDTSNMAARGERAGSMQRPPMCRCQPSYRRQFLRFSQAEPLISAPRR